ncbi:MAG TPA: DUF4382 domain-containing protein, partial [Candidatus Hydrogenedentes bacterium]|nr:DUF4382 domain-containing protein [Candidatus Hydrogenedentota bacterium]
NLSQVFSTSEIPAGVYNKVEIRIQDPRLRLNDDPETELTNVKLTANGRLFINTSFEIPEGENTLITLTFAGIHLVQAGNSGQYVLTPQLSAEIAVSSADVVATGVIEGISPDDDEFVMTLAEGNATVLYAGAAIFLPADTDTPTGTEADLIAGISVQVTGVIDLDGVITATEIRVL